MPRADERTWTVPATVVRVIDGDTIVVDLDLGWRVYPKGSAVTAYACELRPEGAAVLVASQAKPTFERTVGSIEVPGKGDFASLMVEAGHALRAD